MEKRNSACSEDNHRDVLSSQQFVINLYSINDKKRMSVNIIVCCLDTFFIILLGTK